MTSEELKKQRAAPQAGIEGVLERIKKLDGEIRDAESREFIAANKIRMAEIHRPDDSKEWFGTIWPFVDYIKTREHKPWLEWNTLIYRTDDLLRGRMPEMPGRIEHVTE